MKKVIVPILASVIFTAIGVSAMYAFLKFQTEPIPQPKVPEVATNPDVSAKVYVRLPNTEPVEAMNEDFTLPDSLWVVVSKDHPLSDPNYIPSDLQLLTSVATRSDKSEEERSLRLVATEHLTKMLNDAKASGFDLLVGSAFRSFSLQNYYYSNYVKTAGEAVASLYSAKPGESEHQTGLVVDIALASHVCYLETCFGQTEPGKWLATNATKYGFILRYPADKTDITKYQYEPWHFRFVGETLANALEESGLTLDEAYPYLESARRELVNTKLLNEQ